ncbi:uncharacterized protein N0V89_007089 [Didymosphaeria variabile]|uniref:Uncharacterized protein n=1 Tax=Didymosphaeria variabile TaxID=1932322 RepID=A0A9W9CAH6_9PLEO|nr:uncharacterized protein N0V89_007089 [Didymosphaeria variabile]KAJ4351746.1 hypothetical protein N0V89_007089 [Didymosphaeria variabile]
MSKLIGKAVQGISAGIGLAGEKYYDRKERKAALAQQGEPSRSTENHDQGGVQDIDDETNEKSITDEETADDERIWALDEAAGPPPAYEAINSSPDQVIAELAHTVAEANNHQVQIHSGEVSRLPNPVIIPQRRPGSKARGWTRAYAPDLEPLGIDQDTFMKFLESWDKSAQGSPWFKAVALTAGIVGMAMPGPIVMGVTTAVSIAAQAGYELQGRAKANNFLDQMNKDVFMPAGLYAMVIICKQDASVTGGIQLSMETVNLENAKNVSKWGMPGDGQKPTSKSAKFTHPIRLASGKANVDEMPLEIAPLIYPGLDDMIQRPELKRDESFKERMMRNKGFVADYFDRRAQADFSGNNPDAALTKAHGDAPEFKTRFADPNNACNNGHLVSLVTGGKVVVQGRGLLGIRVGGGGSSGRQRGGLLSSALSAARGPQESGIVGGRSRSEDSRGGLLGAGESLVANGQHGSSPGYDYDGAYEYSRRGPRLQDRLGQRRQARGPQYRDVGEDGKLLPKVKQPAQRPRGPIGYAIKGVKKALKADVLYLTIVNLPTEEEMEMAREALGMDKKSWQEIILGMRRR